MFSPTLVFIQEKKDRERESVKEKQRESKIDLERVDLMSEGKVFDINVDTGNI